MVLAPHLGITLGEAAALPRMERLYWQAQYRLDPWGEHRADLRCAITSCVIANSNRKKGAKAFVPKDFMPDFDSEPGKPKQTVKEMESVFTTYMAMHNRAVEAKKRRSG